MPKTLLIAVAVVVCAGCATTRPPVKHTGDVVRDALREVRDGEPRDQVLWQYRGALAALRRGQHKTAGKLFEDALVGINALMGPNQKAADARSNFTAESEKTFIGEPYERVMANFYRGIVYWRDGELDNARACFKNAQFMDADAAKSEYRSDYALLELLVGYLTARHGGDGSDSYRLAAQAAKLTKPEIPPPDSNVVVFVDYGAAPRKTASGEYKEQLRFEERIERSHRARLVVDGDEYELGPIDDLYWQATTRGGRVMDHVLKDKAVFKKTTGETGAAAVDVGLAVAKVAPVLEKISSGAGIFGSLLSLGLMVGGGVSMGVSAAANPAADLRAWDSLPRYLSFTAFKLPPGTHEGWVEYLNDDDTVVLTQDLELVVPPSPDVDLVLYLSDGPR